MWILGAIVLVTICVHLDVFLSILGFFLITGFLDVKRNSPCDQDVLLSYFTRNGILTWVLSPLNLLIDLLSARNSYIFSVKDFPEETQEEIQHLLKAFDDNKKDIMAKLDAQMEENSRGMLFYKWYGKQLNTDIEAFNKDFKYIRTIGVSVFNKKKSTSLHYGPLRLTVRLLYNFSKVTTKDAYIDVGRRRHYWADDPIFIFDDTLRHRSVNDTDDLRYCAFVDILRPSYLLVVLDVMLSLVRQATMQINRIFYKNWTFLK